MAKRLKTDLLVVHVTATPWGKDFHRADIEAMHKARGFSAIGYNKLITLSGIVEEGRGDFEIGAHVEGYNSVAWGISMVGGLGPDGKPANTMTISQEQALLGALASALELFPGARICGHRDLSPDRDGDGSIEPSEWTKMCPCFDAIPWARRHNLPAANIRGVWDEKAPPRPAAPDAEFVAWQRRLARAGYAFGPIDGFVGKRTRAALEQYQIANGIATTAVFDEATKALLLKAFP